MAENELFSGVEVSDIMNPNGVNMKETEEVIRTFATAMDGAIAGGFAKGHIRALVRGYERQSGEPYTGWLPEEMVIDLLRGDFDPAASTEVEVQYAIFRLVRDYLDNDDESSLRRVENLLEQYESHHGKLFDGLVPIQFCKNWDQTIDPREKAVLVSLEGLLSGESKCPHLDRLDRFFYYCSKRAPQDIDTKPALGNPLFEARISSVEMQIFCLSADCYKRCALYKEEEK